MSIKLTWKDNTTREVLYEIYKIDTVSGDRVKIADVPSGPVPNDRDGTYEWIGGGEWDCGDHKFDIAAVSQTDQRAWLSEPLYLTLPCDQNIVICNRFETNAGNSAANAAKVDSVYNLNTYTSTVPSVKENMSTSAYFNGVGVVQYGHGGPNASKLSFFPDSMAGETNRDFTIEGWFKFDNFTTDFNENGGVLFTGSKGIEAVPRPSIEGGVYHTPAEADGSKVAKVYFKCTAGTQTGNPQEYITSVPIISPGEWTHIAWVKKQSKLLIYIGGEFFEQFNFVGLNIAPKATTNGMRIGAGTSAYMNANPGMQFQGSMVDFRIINGQAITICPDTFPDPTCVPGQPVDEGGTVPNEWLDLTACEGVNNTSRVWMDQSNNNPVQMISQTSVEHDPDACPCEALIKNQLILPKTSTFRELNSFSFAAYFKTTDVIEENSAFRDLIDLTHKEGPAKYGFKITLSSTEGGNNGTLDIVVGTGLSGEWKTYSSLKNRWKANLWHHVIVIHHGFFISIYIDGQFHRMVPNVQSIENHVERGYIGGGNWQQKLYLSTLQFYKNVEFNNDDIARVYDPPADLDVKNCLPPKYPPSEPECDELKLHLTEAGRPYANEFTHDHPLLDSSKFARNFVSITEQPLITQQIEADLNSSLETTTPSPLLSAYYDMNDYVKHSDDLRFNEQSSFCIDGWFKTDEDIDITKNESIWSVTTGTKTYNGTDWYIRKQQDKIEFAHGITRIQADLPAGAAVQWSHMVFSVLNGEKQILIDGVVAPINIFNDISESPTDYLKSYVKIQGVFDDLRIIKDDHVYSGPYTQPTEPRSYICRPLAADKTCVIIDNDEYFNNWDVTTLIPSGSTSDTNIIEHPTHETMVVETTTGPQSYVSLTKSDVVLFDYALSTTRQINVTTKVEPIRTESTDGHELYLAIKQSGTVHLYSLGTTGAALDVTDKQFTIDMETFPGWDSGVKIGNGVLDTTGATQTQYGIAVGSVSSGKIITKFHEVRIEIVGSRCIDVITPNNPGCNDTLLHITSNDEGTIRDYSSHMNTLTHSAVSHVTGDSKYGNTSLEFDAVSAGYVSATNSKFNFKTEPFTIEFWSNLDDVNTKQYMYSLSDGISGGHFYTFIENNDITVKAGSAKFTIDAAKLADEIREHQLNYTGNKLPLADNWHHYAVVGDGENLHVYADGALAVKQEYELPDLPGEFAVGSLADINNTYTGNYKGKLDDFRVTSTTVYNGDKFLTPDKHKILLSDYTVAACTNTVLQLQSRNFPEGNTIVNDYSGKDNIVINTGVLNTNTNTILDSTSVLRFNNKVVNVKNTTQFDILSGDDFTIDGWFNANLIGTTNRSNENVNGYGIITKTNLKDDLGWGLFVTPAGSIGFQAKGQTDNIHTVSAESVVQKNTWHHFAVTRSDNKLNVYIDGVSRATAYSNTSIISSSPITVGKFYSSGTGFLNSSMQDVRFVVGESVYNGCATTFPDIISQTCSDYVTPDQPDCDNILSHMQIGSLDITDRVLDMSKHAHDIGSSDTINIKQDSDRYYYDFQSSAAAPLMYTLPESVNKLSDNFTIETYIKPQTTAESTILWTGETVNDTTGFHLKLSIDNNKPVIRFISGGVDIKTPVDKVTLNQWNHVAVVRTGLGDEQTIIYVNGVSAARFKLESDVIIHTIDGSRKMTVGGTWTSTAVDVTLNAGINDIRLTDDHVVYLGDFQLPELDIVRVTNEEPLLSDVKLFIQSEGNSGSETIVDISKKQYSILNPSSNVTHSQTQKKFGESSINFPGTGELLLPRLRTDFTEDLFHIQDTDFTYEMWIYPEFTNEERILLSLDRDQFNDQAPDDIGHDTIYMSITDDNGIECKIRSYNSGNPFVPSNGTGVGVITTQPGIIKENTWQHVAWTRTNGIFKVYVDGVDHSIDQSLTSTGSVATWPYAAMHKTKNERVELNYIIGGNGVDPGFVGHIDGFRYVKGYSVYSECSYVVPTDKSPLNRQTPKEAECDDVKLHLRADVLYGIADFSGNENTTVVDDLVKDDTNFVLNGSSSIPLSGQGVVTVTNEEYGDFGAYTSPITYETWLKPPTVPPNSGNGIQVFNSQPIVVFVSHETIVVFITCMVNGVTPHTERIEIPVIGGDWAHLAITHPSHKTWNVYLNGERVAFKTFNFDLTYLYMNQISVGSPQTADSTVHVDDLRITTDIIFSGDSNIYDTLLPMCDSSPGTCVEFPEGYETLKLCMSFESDDIQDMSRYTHDVTTESGQSGIVLDEDHQSYIENDEKKYYHEGYHGTRYHDVNISNGINVTSSDHLNIMDQEFAVEMHIPATFTQNFDATDPLSYWTLYHHSGSTGDQLTIAFRPINGTIALVVDLVSGFNQLQLVANTPKYDFTETTRGEALQRVMVSRQQGIVRLYGYYNTDEGQSSVLAADTFNHPLNLNNDVKIGHGNPADPNRNGRWNQLIDSVRVTVGGIMGNCSYFEKKQCIKCEGFTGDVDAVKYICSVARSIGIQPTDIDFDKLYEINNFVVTLKDQEVWDNVRVLYLPVWQNALANSVNVVSPTTDSIENDWIFNQEAGVWEHDTGPYTKLTEYTTTANGNGIMTPFTGADISVTSDDHSYGVYLRTIPQNTQASVMSTTADEKITVDNTSPCNPYSGFLLKSSTTDDVTTYSNGISISTTNVSTLDPSHRWVIGGEGINGSGVMQKGVNEIEIQSMYFGTGLDKQKSQQLSSALVKLIQTFDSTDTNPSDVLSDDYLINKVTFAILNRMGYTYTLPSWIRERNAMKGLDTQSLQSSDIYNNLKQYYQTAKTEGWSDKIKTLHLPMWRDSNVNKINFHCPGVYDIDKWNKRSPFWKLDNNSTLLNPPVDSDGNTILPDPFAYFNAEDITDDPNTYITEWNDQSSNNNMILDTSAHDNLETEPTGPVFVDNGGINGDEKCVKFNYNGSRDPQARHNYLNRPGNQFRMVMNSGLDVTRPKHVFLVYRNITSINGSTPITFDITDKLERPGYTTAPGLTQLDHTEGESVYSTNYGVMTINGYQGSYWKNDSNGKITWTPDPITIWPDNSVTTTAGTPMLSETRFGKRVVHVNMAEMIDNDSEHVTCPYPEVGDDGAINLPSDVKLCLGNLDTNNPVCIHGEYYEMVVYSDHLTHDQVEAVYNYLCSKHEVSLHEDYTNHMYSGSVEHGHGKYAYIPNNNPVTVNGESDTTQGTEINIPETDVTYAYGSEYLGITNTAGGFGSIKFDTTTCTSTTHTENTMGSLVGDGWTLGKSTNTFNIPETTGIDIGFSYINRGATDNLYYLNNFITPVSTYTRQSTTIPVENPYLFSTGDTGSPKLGTKDKYQAFFYTDDLVTTQQLSGFGGAITNLTSNTDNVSPATCATYSSNPYVQNYLCAVVKAGGIHPSAVATDNRAAAINDYITNLMANNELTDLYTAMYLPVWKCAEANKINLLCPGDKDLLIDNDKINHETGEYLHYLGTGTGDQFSNEVVVPYKPKDIINTPCDETHSTSWTDSLNFDVFVNLVNLPASSARSPVMWRFQQNELSNNTQDQQNYTNDYYNPDVSEHDLVGVTWPGLGTDWHAGPYNTQWKDQTGDGVNPAPMYKYKHDHEQQGGLLKCRNTETQSQFGLDTTRSGSVASSGRLTAINSYDYTLKDIGGLGDRTYNVPQYYMTMPLGGAKDTCTNFIAIGRNIPDDVALRELLFKLSGASYKTYTDTILSSDDLECHGAHSLTNGDVLMLASVKNNTKVRSNEIPQSLNTTSTPLTSVWDDDRSWNFTTGDRDLADERPGYTQNTDYRWIHGKINNGGNRSHATDIGAISFGYACRRPQGSFDDLTGREYITGSDRPYYVSSSVGAIPYIRGLTSGAVRRSTFGHAGNQHNDNPSNNEKRYMQFKIIHDSPQKGAFVGGGSFRTADTIFNNATSWFDTSSGNPEIDDSFNKYPSNNIPFQQGEAVEIGHIDHSGDYLRGAAGTSYHQHGSAYQVGNPYKSVDCLPLRSNIEYYNGKYIVAEVNESTTGQLSDGPVFSAGTTHGGPKATGDGTAHDLHAWMRLEMQDIETIDIGPTNKHDLVITSTLSGTTLSPVENWTTRLYIDHANINANEYKLNKGMNEQIHISGTYSDYIVVNYDTDKHEMYSLNMSSTGDAQTTTQPNTNNYTQAFMLQMATTSGKPTAFRSTKGSGWSKCTSSVEDSMGNIYMTGHISGDVDFTDNHGMLRDSNRGVNTGAKENMFGFLAKSHKDETQIDSVTKYKPLDYTWAWVNYIDTTTESLSGTRVISDIAVDPADNVYVIGYYDHPSEIGRSGASNLDNDTLAFEPGYVWDDTTSKTVFVSKFEPEGKCLWTKRSTVDSVDQPSQKILVHRNHIYTVNVANGLSFNTQSLSGVCVDRFDQTTGDILKSINYNNDTDQTEPSGGWNLTVTDFKISDRGMILITGTCTGESLVSDNITFTNKFGTPATDETIGYAAFIPTFMETGKLSFTTTTNPSTTPVKFNTSVVDYSTGLHMVIGTVNNWVSGQNVSAGFGSPTDVINISKPTNAYNNVTFALTYEL